MVVSTIPFWVRLTNLPLPFWHHKVLEEIKKNLGKFIKIDLERIEKSLYIFSRTCVEIDCSKGLPYHIQLKHEKFQWNQELDYENMEF